ncbi:MAG TPA: hypothetical protein VFX70_02375 [Mycobacteriales bacterium]|nr:hypothetical protein [Mycobacteriales bacterium]
MTEHPGLVLRDGPTGRRAGLAGGPDVWEIVRAIRSARVAEPGLDPDELLTLVTCNTGVPAHLLRTAVRYRASYPAEIDREIEAATRAEDAAEQAWRRETDLLAR